MNTKIIVSLATILVVGAAAVGGTFAYFSITRTSTGNTFTASTMTMDIKYSGTATTGPTLKVANFYPGSFVQGAMEIDNTNGTNMKMNPEIKLANESGVADMANYLDFEVWTNGKLWYSGPIKGFPGYAAGIGKVLDPISPAGSEIVAYRVIMNETAPSSLQGAVYSVDIMVTGHQWNDPDYPISTPQDIKTNDWYLASAWSYSVCGVRQPGAVPFWANGTCTGTCDSSAYSPLYSYSVQSVAPNGWLLNSGNLNIGDTWSDAWGITHAPSAAGSADTYCEVK